MGKTKKISKSFIGFLVASTLMWLLITLSKDYSVTLTFPVSFSNIPQDKLLQDKTTKKIDVLVQASGYNILRSRFRNKEIILKGNVLNRKKVNKYYFLTKDQLSNIKNQLLSGIQLEEVLQDTIYLNLATLTSKKVALLPNLNIKYQVGYENSEDLKLTPDSIVVSGPKDQIEKISNLKLEFLKLENVKSDFSKELKIVIPGNSSKIKTSSRKAILSGKVERFTEGSIEVPIEIINLPEGVELTTLNKKVEIVYVVGLSNFDKIDESFFRVYCDYKLAEENNLNYLLPKVELKSNLIKSYKVLPNKIDFLIHK
ncbi:CdaR family protein [Polaribacter sp. Asnod1-A03]|uniref:CdaR family protein n=1 Tax=Polaribacter sp. Asnod1-A03 TaxID=3160581 RepID=UPI003870D6D2